MGGIFLSYRREDTAGYSGRLADALRDNFGDAVIFRDVDAITPGNDFVHAITTAVADADVLLAVIGPRWLTAKDKQRRRRIDDPEDYVRLEITAALSGGRKVVPVLVDGARLPWAENLPEPLRPLLRIQAIELTDSRWGYDLGVLVAELRPTVEGALEEPSVGPTAPAPVTTTRRLRRRLRVIGVLSALLVGALVAGYVQTRSGADLITDPVSKATPTTTVPAPTSSSSIPEPTTTAVATSTIAPPRPTTPTSTPPPTPPPPPTSSPPPTNPRPPPPRPPSSYLKLSGDGVFGAYKSADNHHFVIARVSTGETLFTTHPQFDGEDAIINDVKEGRFCSDPTLFAATYHYSAGAGAIYSWIAIWSTSTRQIVPPTGKAPGEVYDLNC